jgi:hypothetical protein
MKNRDPYDPGKPPLISTGLITACVVTIVWAVAEIIGTNIWGSILIAVVGLGVLFAAERTAIRKWRAHKELPAYLRKNLASILRVELNEASITCSRHSKGTMFRPGPPKKIRIQAAGMPPMEGDIAKRVLFIASDFAGDQYIINAKQSKPGKRIVLVKKPKEKEVDLTPRQAVEQAIVRGASEIFPKKEPKVECTWDEERDEDYLLEVTITEVDGMELSLSGKRRQILTKLRSRLPKGNFVSDVEPQDNTIYFRRSKPLPGVVVPPKEHAPLLANHKAYRDFNVPLGMGNNHSAAVWKPRRDAHLLIIGGTGGGKTICEHGVIQRLSQAGWRVWLVDGKRIEFIGYREWANVELLAQRVDDQIRVLKLAHETMEARYDLVMAGEVKIEDLDPIAIVVDELTSLLGAVKRRYLDTKDIPGKKMPTKDPVLDWIADIARLGRTAKMHLVLGLQRPDASIMGGELRDNFGCRISLGRLKSKEASMMMWDDPAIGLSVPDVPGRAVSVVDGVPTMVQGTFTANPDPNHDDYHRNMVAAMRPVVEVYSRKTVATPEPDEESKTGEPTWLDIIGAPLLGPDGEEVVFDPVSSEESKTLRQGAKASVSTEENMDLQSADSFSEALELFANAQMQMLVQGKSLAHHLSQLANEMYDRASEQREQARQVAPQKLTGINTDALGDTRTVELRYVEPGQTIVVDALGGEEVTVSSCEPDDEDPNTYYLAGYSVDGEEVVAELPADSSVEAFDMVSA